MERQKVRSSAAPEKAGVRKSLKIPYRNGGKSDFLRVHQERRGG